jgi:hypothetical protein
LIVTLASTVTACDGTRRSRASRNEDAATAPYQAEVEEGLGAAVAILVDTSGSMRDEAPSGRGPDEVAREMFQKSEHGVRMRFVAFDTSADRFGFLKDASLSHGKHTIAALERRFA